MSSIGNMLGPHRSFIRPLPCPHRWVAAVLVGCAVTTAMPSLACPGSGPLSVLVPYAAGGSVDATTRAMARVVSVRMGRPISVVNVPGASGLIAVRQLLAAPADGCTLFSGSLNNVALLPLQNPRASYSSTDLQPLARIGVTGLTLVANPSLGLRDIDGLRAAAAKGRVLKAGHPGLDSLQAVALKIIEKQLATPLVHVPYSGAGPLITDLLGGHLDIAVLAQPAAVPLIRRGAVVALDVARLPDGTPFVSWSGWFAARDVQPAALAATRRGVDEALNDSGLIQTLSELGVKVEPTTREKFVQEIAATADRLRPLLAAANPGGSGER